MMAAKKSNIDPNLLLTGALIIGGGFVLYKLSNLFSNTVDSITAPSANAQAALDSQINNPGWDPNYYKTHASPKLLFTQAGASQLAQQLKNEFTWYLYVVDSVNFDNVWNVFQQIKTRTQLSQLCDTYLQSYGDNLFDTMYKYLYGDSKFNTDEYMLRITNYVNALPDAVPA